MSDISMETLLQIASQTSCDELYVTAEDRISVLSEGRVVSLETRHLTPEDTIRLMKEVTPETYRQEMELNGSVEFGCIDANEDRFHLSLCKDSSAIRMVVRRMTQ